MPVVYTIQGVAVMYTPFSMGGNLAPHDHFELRSEHISETGYRSHFVPSETVQSVGGAETYAAALIDQFWIAPDNQMALF